MASLITKILNTQTDQWKLVMDLIGQIALFSAMFYMGGYIYRITYFREFFINPEIVTTDISLAVAEFIHKVVFFNLISVVVFSIGFALFILLFYFARNFLKSFYSYVAICASLVGIFLLLSFVATKVAVWQAERDWHKNTKLPSVKVFIKNGLNIDSDVRSDLTDARFHMLFETKDRLILFNPQKANEATKPPVLILNKSAVEYIDVR